MTDTTKARGFMTERGMPPEREGMKGLLMARKEVVEFMTDFAAQCVAEAVKEERGRIAAAWRNFHYADCRLARDGECRSCDFIDTLKGQVPLSSDL